MSLESENSCGFLLQFTSSNLVSQRYRIAISTDLFYSTKGGSNVCVLLWTNFSAERMTFTTHRLDKRLSFRVLHEIHSLRKFCFNNLLIARFMTVNFLSQTFHNGFNWHFVVCVYVCVIANSF